MRVNSGTTFPDDPRRWVVAGNRFGTPRTQATSGAGNKMMSTRLHKSAPVQMDALACIYNWFVSDTLLGEIAPGTTATVAAGIEFPLGTPAGTAKAFKFGGSFTAPLIDFQMLVSDVNATVLPANTLFRMRSFMDCPGFPVYGRNGLNTNGGSMAGFGGEVDRSSWSPTQTNQTQSATVITAFTGDTAYEPILIGLAHSPIDAYSIVGDSITAGLDDLILPGPSNPNAGDTYGNGGYAERAMGIADKPYINVARPGSRAADWATTSSTERIEGYSRFCNKGILALGRNDLGVDDAPTILNNLAIIYRRMKKNLQRVIVVTIPPATITTDVGVTLAGQTVHSYEQVRIDVNTGIRAGNGGVWPVGDVFDHEASVRDTSTGPILWRVDGGAWSFTGLHPTTISATAAGADLAAML